MMVVVVAEDGGCGGCGGCGGFDQSAQVVPTELGAVELLEAYHAMLCAVRGWGCNLVKSRSLQRAAVTVHTALLSITQGPSLPLSRIMLSLPLSSSLSLSLPLPLPLPLPLLVCCHCTVTLCAVTALLP